jgi:hypothetical protein
MFFQSTSQATPCFPHDLQLDGIQSFHNIIIPLSASNICQMHDAHEHYARRRPTAQRRCSLPSSVWPEALICSVKPDSNAARRHASCKANISHSLSFPTSPYLLCSSRTISYHLNHNRRDRPTRESHFRPGVAEIITRYHSVPSHSKNQLSTS